MPDLTGFPALDVVIGLAFLYFLLSTFCSGINEFIAAMLGWRAKTLEDGIASLVGDPNVLRTAREWFGLKADPKKVAKKRQELHDKAVKKSGTSEANAGAAARSDPFEDLAHDILEHWSVKALVRDPDAKSRRRARPSYLPPDVFSLAFVETLAKRIAKFVSEQPKDKVGAGATQAAAKTLAAKTPWAAVDAKLVKEADKLADQLPVGRELVRRAITEGGKDLEAFRTEVEKAFDDTMARASGWYKRKAQLMVFVIALAVTAAMNVDTINVANRLWNDEPLRVAVTSAATNAVTQAPGGPNAPTGSKGTSSTVPKADPKKPTGKVEDCQPSEADPTVPNNVQGCIQYQANRAGQALDKVDALKLPIGWNHVNKPKDLSFLGGWLLTVLALSLGAPFWFDLLNKLVRLRTTGVPEDPDTSGSVGQTKPASGSQRRVGVPKRGKVKKVPHDAEDSD